MSHPEPGQGASAEASEPAAETASARLLAEDFALLLAAMLIVALPGLLSRCAPSAATVVRGKVEPLAIDVESAPWHEWTLLDGIGEARARRIAEHVRRHAPVRSAADLERVPGMPSGWAAKALPYLRFGGGPLDALDESGGEAARPAEPR